MPRLFVLADALQPRLDAGLGARRHRHDLAAIRCARPPAALSALHFTDDSGYDETDRGKALNRGVEAAHAVMVKMFERMRAGEPLKFEDIVSRRKTRSSRRSSTTRCANGLTTVGCHHQETYRPLPVRDRLLRSRFRSISACATTTSVGSRARRCCTMSARPFVPVALLDKPGALTVEEMAEMREHPRRGYEALSAQGGFPPEMTLDVILHHHEFPRRHRLSKRSQRQPESATSSASPRSSTSMPPWSEKRVLPACNSPTPRRSPMMEENGRQARPAIAAGRSARWRSGIIEDFLPDRHCAGTPRNRVCGGVCSQSTQVLCP